MDVRTFKAASMHEALALVRRELGPQAAVLHTREVYGGLPWRLIPGMRKIEVTASAEVNVPSRLPAKAEAAPAMEKQPQNREENPPGSPAIVRRFDAKHNFNTEVTSQLSELQTMMTDLCRRTRSTGREELP